MDAGSSTEPILGDVRRVLGLADPVPSSVRAGARALFSLRRLDELYAELVRRFAEGRGVDRQDPRGDAPA